MMEDLPQDEYPVFDETLYQRMRYLENLVKQQLEQQDVLTRALTNCLHRIHELEEANYDMEGDGDFRGAGMDS